MQRVLVFVFGTVSYVIFLGVFLYLAGFLANFFVPRTIENGIKTPLTQALLIDFGLVLLFGLQHTVMARPNFKKWLTKTVPQPAERGVYVMLTNIVLILLYWQWRPTTETIWHIQNSAGQAAMYGLLGLGFLIVLVTTFLINHFDLFGLRQIWLHLKGKEYTSLGFVLPGPYKFVRHPLYVGWIIAFWATPLMSYSHLLFAAGMTVYILIAIYYEERDMVKFFSEYGEYRKKVPMLIPRFFGNRDAS